MNPDLFLSREAISPRVYQNRIKEQMTRVHPILPFLFYIPVSLFFIIFSIARNPAVLPHFLWIVPAVVFFWTLLEYALHKHVLHDERMGVIAKIHVTHHEYPNDPLRLAVPLWSSIPGGLVFYFGFRLLVGPELINPFFGVLVGMYVVYEFTHLAVHKYNWKNPFFQKFKKHHLRHHFNDNTKGFGFTTIWWDRLFERDA